MVTKQLVLRNRSYYFFSNAVFLEDFDPKMLKLVKTIVVIGMFIILIML